MTWLLVVILPLAFCAVVLVLWWLLGLWLKGKE